MSCGLSHAFCAALACTITRKKKGIQTSSPSCAPVLVNDAAEHPSFFISHLQAALASMEAAMGSKAGAAEAQVVELAGKLTAEADRRATLEVALQEVEARAASAANTVETLKAALLAAAAQREELAAKGGCEGLHRTGCEVCMRYLFVQNERMHSYRVCAAGIFIQSVLLVFNAWTVCDRTW